MKAGSELSIQYNHLMMGRRSRRESFRQGWFFDCKCCRCSDATEMGSYVNALLCQLCPPDERGKFTLRKSCCLCHEKDKIDYAQNGYSTLGKDG